MLALIVSSVLIGFAYGACGNGWEHNGAWCYFISRDNATMPGAVVTCTYLGGTLALVDSNATQTFLETKMKESKYSAGNAFWIDGNDQLVEGIWVDRGGQPLSYTNWAKNQPNNQPPGNQWGIENCIAIRRNDNFGYFWNDEPCEVKNGYVCRKSFATGAGLVG